MPLPNSISSPAVPPKVVTTHHVSQNEVHPATLGSAYPAVCNLREFVASKNGATIVMEKAKAPRKLNKKRVKDLTREERKARRIRLNAAYKKRIRRERRAEVAAQRKIDNARCVDLDKLRSLTVQSADRPGCWIWTGPLGLSWNRVVPRIHCGQYGSMMAARAMWLALGRSGLGKKHTLRTSCGHYDCVAPDHLYLSHPSAERAREALDAQPVRAVEGEVGAGTGGDR